MQEKPYCDSVRPSLHLAPGYRTEIPRLPSLLASFGELQQLGTPCHGNFAFSDRVWTFGIQNCPHWQEYVYSVGFLLQGSDEEHNTAGDGRAGRLQGVSASLRETTDARDHTRTFEPLIVSWIVLAKFVLLLSISYGFKWNQRRFKQSQSQRNSA